MVPVPRMMIGATMGQDIRKGRLGELRTWIMLRRCCCGIDIRGRQREHTMDCRGDIGRSLIRSNEDSPLLEAISRLSLAASKRTQIHSTESDRRCALRDLSSD